MAWHISTALLTAYENSLSSQGQEVVSSEGNSLDGAPFAPSNGNPIPPLYLPEGRMKAFSRLSRYGMTFKPLTEDLGADLLTWYLAASRARTSAPQEKVQASQESAAGCGRTWRGLLARYDPDTRSWRTAQYSLLGDLELYSETWPRWGTMRNGECSERCMPAHLTEETASGFLLPTVVKSDMRARRPSRNWDGSDLPSTLWVMCGGKEDGEKPPLKLHPEMAEWMLAWPTGWSGLQRSVTVKFQRWSALHGILFTNDL